LREDAFMGAEIFTHDEYSLIPLHFFGKRFSEGF
jgi:hypothetical protein